MIGRSSVRKHSDKANLSKWRQRQEMLVSRRWKDNFCNFVTELTQSINCAIRTPRKEANSPTVEATDKRCNQTSVSASQQLRAPALVASVTQKAVYNLICTAKWRLNFGGSEPNRLHHSELSNWLNCCVNTNGFRASVIKISIGFSSYRPTFRISTLVLSS
jgi:hypothetical protein